MPQFEGGVENATKRNASWILVEQIQGVVHKNLEMIEVLQKPLVHMLHVAFDEASPTLKANKLEQKEAVGNKEKLK